MLRACRVPKALVCLMCYLMLGVKAFQGVKLYLESLPFRCYPAGIDSLVLRIWPIVLTIVHLISAILQTLLDFSESRTVIFSIETACVSDSVRNLSHYLTGCFIRFG